MKCHLKVKLGGSRASGKRLWARRSGLSEFDGTRPIVYADIKASVRRRPLMMSWCLQGQFPRQPPVREHDELRERTGTAAAPAPAPRACR